MASSAQILFDGRYIQDRYHGIGRYAYHLVRELAALAPELRVALLRDPLLPEHRFDWDALTSSPSVYVEQVRAPLFSIREQLAIPRVRARHLNALYHSPYFALPWLLAPPAAVTVHDCIFERDPRYMPRRWARVYYRLLMLVSLRRSRAVFVPSRATAADVRRFYSVRGGKLVVTPEAADSSFRRVRDESRLEAVRAKHQLPHRFVLAVGARRPHKNFGLLVRAVAASRSNVPLVFVGEADERFPDEAAVAAASLGDRVRFLGKVDEPELPVLYSLATVFACPSTVEGFGLPVLEAMACGAPVICSDIPVLREVAGDAALLAGPRNVQAWASAIDHVTTSEAEQARLRTAGLERAGLFSWREAASAVLRTYRKLGYAR